MSASSLIGEQKTIQIQLKGLEEQLQGSCLLTIVPHLMPYTDKKNALNQLAAVNRPLPELIDEAERKIQSIKR